jgi:phage/plasmid-associated DNA primase
MSEEQKPKKNPVYLSMDFIDWAKNVVMSNDELYVWNGKFYEQQKKSDLYRKIWEFFEHQKILNTLRRSKAEEIIDLLKMNPQVKDVDLDRYETLMNLNNCIYDIESDMTIPRDPSFHFSYALDIDYDPVQTEHPTFDKFISNLFMRKGHPDRATEELLLHIMAYLIYPKIKREAIFMFLGGGENGKSVLIEVIKMFFPKKFVTSLSLNILSNEESFFRAQLFHSKLNIATEQRASSTQKVNSEEIKKISSGEDTTIRGLYKEAVNFRPFTKLVVASNSFPYFNDTSHGIDRRIFMVGFNNQFLLPAKYEEAKQDGEDPTEKNIYRATPKDELFAAIHREKPAIFNTLIKYLHKLRANGWQFPVTENSESIKAEYNQGADILGTWLKDNYKVNHKMYPKTPSTDILGSFRSFYDINYPGQRGSTHSVQAVGRKISDIFRVTAEREWRVINGQRINTTVYPLQLIYAEPTDPSEHDLDSVFK